jgi:hypothetical protein
MQLLIEHTDGDDVVEVQVKQAAALHVVTPLVLRGHGQSSLAAALEGVQRSGVPCIVEESSGQAAGAGSVIVSRTPGDSARRVDDRVGRRAQPASLARTPAGRRGFGGSGHPGAAERWSQARLLRRFLKRSADDRSTSTDLVDWVEFEYFAPP